MARSTLYSLKKSRHVLKSSYKWYQKQRQHLSANDLKNFENQLQQLDDALLKGDRPQASSLAQQLEEFNQKHFKKTFWNYLTEMALAISVALIVATIVRQMWFEPYEIPTGSMRPTFKEQDHLTVSKTAFGINVPLATQHFYFNPDLVQRSSVIIWSGDGIPHLESDSTFMGIFPYTKRYIKRCMGKPGDTLYFYGGKIYGIDSQGNDLVELRDDPWTKHLEYLPFTSFEGQRSYLEERQLVTAPQVIFRHFNQAIGRLRFLKQGIKGEIFNGKEWVEDKPEAQRNSHQTIQTYSDFWGTRNFAMARLLTKQQLESLTPHKASDMEEGLLYLELRHTPSLSYPSPLLSEHFGVGLKGYSTVLPLQEKHLQALMKTTYTSRFLIKNNKGIPYSLEKIKTYASSPSFPQVPDGTYEFYYGKAVRVGWGGITFALPSDHPLYNQEIANIQRLFNVGIEMSTQVEPRKENQFFYPNRYAYFREGNLYVMGGIIVEKEVPLLRSFHTRELKREQASTQQNPYVAFKDYGPPLTSEGQLDKNFIKTFGFKIPEKHYLALGDNHAMSKDSRSFGPIPQANLQGAPSSIIWPPGERWGIPNQKPYPLLTFPREIIWGIAACLAVLWLFFHRRKLRQPIFKKLP